MSEAYIEKSIIGLVKEKYHGGLLVTVEGEEPFVSCIDDPKEMLSDIHIHNIYGTRDLSKIKVERTMVDDCGKVSYKEIDLKKIEEENPPIPGHLEDGVISIEM